MLCIFASSSGGFQQKSLGGRVAKFAEYIGSSQVVFDCRWSVLHKRKACKGIETKAKTGFLTGW